MLFLSSTLKLKSKEFCPEKSNQRELLVGIRLGKPDGKVSELYSFVPLRIGKEARMKLDKQNIFNYKGI